MESTVEPGVGRVDVVVPVAEALGSGPGGYWAQTCQPIANRLTNSVRCDKAALGSMAGNTSSAT